MLDRELLGELEGRWRTQGAPIAVHLRPGLSGVQTDRLVSSLGLVLPSQEVERTASLSVVAQCESGRGPE